MKWRIYIIHATGGRGRGVHFEDVPRVEFYVSCVYTYARRQLPQAIRSSVVMSPFIRVTSVEHHYFPLLILQSADVKANNRTHPTAVGIGRITHTQNSHSLVCHCRLHQSSVYFSRHARPFTITEQTDLSLASRERERIDASQTHDMF